MNETANLNQASVYVLIPTYQELPSLQRALTTLAAQTYQNLSVVVINSHPGDETSAFLRDHPFPFPLVEVSATGHDYWTGAINKGLAWVKARAGSSDFILLLNSDVQLPAEAAARYVEQARQHPRALFCAATVSDGRYQSSGCRVRSWLWALTVHPLLGEAYPASSGPALIPVDMLAGRAMFFPAGLLHEMAPVDETYLPHYGADYVFSCRAKREAGYRLYILSDLTITVDRKHTGKKMYHPGVGLAARVRALFHIKSAANLKYRLRLVRACYPRYALPTALAVTCAKSLIETTQGPAAYRFFGKGYR